VFVVLSNEYPVIREDGPDFYMEIYPQDHRDAHLGLVLFDLGFEENGSPIGVSLFLD
jgi:hypothetical protein